MDNEREINIAKGCVMASFLDSETKQMVIESLEQMSIPKKETTSCEWCKDAVSRYFDINWYKNDYQIIHCTNFCPNCGRRLEEKNHGSKENY